MEYLLRYYYKCGKKSTGFPFRDEGLSINQALREAFENKASVFL